MELKQGADLRLPQYRREVFLRFYQFHLRYRAHPGCVYYLLPWLRQREGWSKEQALWFAFLNGNTQNPVTSWLIFQQFPLPMLGSAIQPWFDLNWPRLQFDTDRRYQKKLLPAACDVYLRAFSQYGSQQAFWSRAGTFREYWKVATQELIGFGRLSAWSYLEYLRILGVPVEPDTLFLRDMNGSRSHRNGLAIVLGRDDLDFKEGKPLYAPGELDWLEREGALLLRDAQERDQRASYWTLESALCTYKSWHRPNRRYPNVYNDMLVERIRWAEQRWPEVSLSMFWQARLECLPAWLRVEDCPDDPGLSPQKQNWYRETGQVLLLGHDWPEMQDSGGWRIQR